MKRTPRDQVKHEVRYTAPARRLTVSDISIGRCFRFAALPPHISTRRMWMRTRTRRTRIRLIAWLSCLACVAAVLAIGGAASATPAGPSAPPAANTPACQLAYTVTTDWGAGFGITVTITNNGPALTSWTLGYAYAGNQKLQQGWSATWSQTGAQVTATNLSWNGNLATGASTQIGGNFSNSGGTNTAPT